MKYLLFSITILLLVSCSKEGTSPNQNKILQPINLKNRIVVHTVTFENLQDRPNINITAQFASDAGGREEVVFRVNGHDIPHDNMNRYSETYGGGFLETEGMLNSDLKIEVSDATRSFSKSFRNEPFPHVTLNQDKNAVDRNKPLELSWENPVLDRDGVTERMGAYVAHRGSIDPDNYDLGSFSHYTYSKEIDDLESFVIPASELQKFPANSKLEIKLGRVLSIDTGSNIDLSFIGSFSIVIQLL